MGKVLTRQVDPVSLFVFSPNLWKGSGITFPPPAVKATELLLVALGDQFLCLTEGRVWPCLELNFWECSSCGGQQYLEKKSLILQSNWCFLSACAQRLVCFSRNYLSLKNLPVLKLQIYCVFAPAV